MHLWLLLNKDSVMEELFQLSNKYFYYFQPRIIYTQYWRWVARGTLFFLLSGIASASVAIYTSSGLSPFKDPAMIAYFASLVAFSIGSGLLGLKKKKYMESKIKSLPNIKGAATKNIDVKFKKRILCHILNESDTSNFPTLLDKYKNIYSIWDEHHNAFTVSFYECFIQASKFWKFIAIALFGYFLKVSYSDLLNATLTEKFLFVILGTIVFFGCAVVLKGIPYILNHVHLNTATNAHRKERVEYLLSSMALTAPLNPPD